PPATSPRTRPSRMAAISTERPDGPGRRRYREPWGRIAPPATTEARRSTEAPDWTKRPGSTVVPARTDRPRVVDVASWSRTRVHGERESTRGWSSHLPNDARRRRRG